jgi:hypothetical protein
MDLNLADQLIDCTGVRWSGEEQLRFVQEKLPQVVGQRLSPLLLTEPFRGNPHCSPTDAAILFAMLGLHEPTRLMEVGSGFTTLVFHHARRAFNLPGELISIDPAPRHPIGEFVDAQLIMPAQELPVSDYTMLTAGELLFIDSTHVDSSGSEVRYLLSDVLPKLSPGVLVAFHGVRLPRHYNSAELAQGFNEQLRLLDWLKSSGSEVLFSGGWMAEHHPGVVAKALSSFPETAESTALWLRR